MTIPVVIAAGGTGGHLVPGFAIADALRRARTDIEVCFVGTERGLERDLVPKAGYRVRTTGVRPFTRDVKGLLAPASLVPAVVRARAILRTERARAVVGMGGYPSVPVVAAARTLRIPAVIHEANAIPGLANQLAARFTPNVAVAFEEAASRFPRHRIRAVGMPMRNEITHLDREALRPSALELFGLEPHRHTILVLGGSQGAARIDDAIAGVAAGWAERTDVQIVVAAGRLHAERVRAAMPAGALIARVEPFIERMDLAYAAADVAVSRAGASTVFELAAAGVPSILIPFPHARRGEQDANAQALAVPGAAVVIADDRLEPVSLGAALDELLRDRARLERMQAAARGIARPDAADAMARWVLELAESGRG